MSTFDDQRLLREVDAAGPTVREVHQAVRVARLIHCRHGRVRVRGRGVVRRRPLSQYRPAAVVDTTTHPRAVRSDVSGNRRAVSTMAIATVALSLVYVGLIRVFDPGLNQRVLVIGVCLIAVAAAVCLNAFTLGTVTEPAPESGASHPGSAAPGGSPRVTYVNLDRTISRSDDE